ncbi:MAG: phosphatidylserine decarboxylase family protein [Lentisphaerae bacterium]|nr:phosphatidylserine decarboxylase family protein [Lentisphaerota bacterium]
MTLTRYGIREWGGCGLIAIVLLMGCWLLGRYVHVALGVLPALIVLIAYGALCYFFRNPHRTPPDNPEFIVSPADGEVRDIGEVDGFDQKPFEGKALRVGIFLSVLNVHVNRAPAAFQVLTKHYRAGKYLDARSKECAKENEAMTIAGYATVNDEDFPMAVRQISGAIARRIVCAAEPGSKWTRGKIYGMIKFGSRTELYLPVDERFELLVKPGDKVKGGTTVIARFNSGKRSNGLVDEDKRFFPPEEEVNGPGSRWDIPGNGCDEATEAVDAGDKSVNANENIDACCNEQNKEQNKVQ